MIEIKDLNTSQIPYVINISDYELGEQYISKKVLTHLLKGERTTITRVALFDNEISGFAIANTLNSKQLHNILKDNIDLLPKEYLDINLQFGYIKSIIVQKGKQNLGIGKMLCNDLINELRKSGANAYIVTAWKKYGEIPANKILQKSGLNVLCEIPEFWKDESISIKYKCPICGNPPCLCSAVIFGKID